MDRYLNRLLVNARTVGTITSINMGDADKWNPNHIKITGVTEDGEKFAIMLEIGDPKKEGEGDA